jgi:hypothetical protein
MDTMSHHHFLHLSKGGFVAGSKVKGNVYLLVKKNFKVDGFRLAIEGREECTVHYTTTESYSDNGQTHSRSQSHYEYVVAGIHDESFHHICR